MKRDQLKKDWLKRPNYEQQKQNVEQQKRNVEQQKRNKRLNVLRRRRGSWKPNSEQMRLLPLKPTERSGKKLLHRDLHYCHRMCNYFTVVHANLWNSEIAGKKSVENGVESSSSRTSNENNR
jgi:hypothetical protein